MKRTFERQTGEFVGCKARRDRTCGQKRKRKKRSTLKAHRLVPELKMQPGRRQACRASRSVVQIENRGGGVSMPGGDGTMSAGGSHATRSALPFQVSEAVAGVKIAMSVQAKQCSTVGRLFLEDNGSLPDVFWSICTTIVERD
ncbi:MAG: hypothetical protein AB7T86_17165 [Xanthobacteraceae bacterium]|uniref:hypothetical protein n=1 Tax=Pseudolabrys sp. TaxID=1960880 RepID=UPI003D114046